MAVQMNSQPSSKAPSGNNTFNVSSASPEKREQTCAHRQNNHNENQGSNNSAIGNRFGPHLKVFKTLGNMLVI